MGGKKVSKISKGPKKSNNVNKYKFIKCTKNITNLKNTNYVKKNKNQVFTLIYVNF